MTALLLSACNSDSTTTVPDDKWTVTASAGQGGTITPPSSTVNTGQTVSLLLTPASDYQLGSVSGCGGSLSGNTYTTAAITANCSVNASFISSLTPSYTVTATAGTGGTITPPSSNVTAGQTLSLLLTPDSGYQLGTVSGCGGSLSGNTYTTAAVTANCSVSASFNHILVPTYTVTATAGTGGNISPASSTVSSGQTTSLILTPDSGYQIGTVSGCGGTLSGSTYTTAAVTANCSVNASFDAFYTVTAVAGSGGIITPTSQTQLANVSAPLTVIPDSNFILDTLSGCGITPDGSQWKTAPLTADCTVSASFKPRLSLFAGGFATCSLLDDSDNTINKCWGQNSSGQLGTLSFSLTAHGDEAGEAPGDNDAMTLVNSLTILSMELGSQHACAVMSDNNVYCWGENQNGQLGIGTNADQKIMDLMVNLDDEPVAEVSAGGQFSCARQFNGQVRCWGLNSSGELGVGNTSTWFVPPPIIPTLADRAVQVTAGSAHACARLLNNQVQCWGDNSSGQLGDSDGGNDSATPSNVTLSGTVTDIAAGGLFACIIVDGNIRCWGENGSGQLGNNDGTNTDLDVPSANLNIGSEVPVKLATGSEHACVLTQSGKVYCWGESDAGQTGQNDTTDDLAPLLVNLGSNYTTATVTSISAGGDHTCVVLKSTNPLDNNHPVRCWGEGGIGQLGLEDTSDIGDNEVVDNSAFNVKLQP